MNVLRFVIVVLAAVCASASPAMAQLLINSGGEFYVKPSDTSLIDSYVYQWGTQPKTYTGSFTVVDPNDVTLTFKEAGLVPGKTYYAVVDTKLKNGDVLSSEEISFTIREDVTNEFCIRGTVNGQVVDFCVPANIRPQP